MFLKVIFWNMVSLWETAVLKIMISSASLWRISSQNADSLRQSIAGSSCIFLLFCSIKNPSFFSIFILLFFLDHICKTLSIFFSPDKKFKNCLTGQAFAPETWTLFLEQKALSILTLRGCPAEAESLSPDAGIHRGTTSCCLEFSEVL